MVCGSTSGVPAFLPGSQVDLRPVRNLDDEIGKTYDFKVLKFNKRRGNIVVSRRALLESEREALRSKTLEKIEEEKVMSGVVKNITDYGAFIDPGRHRWPAPCDGHVVGAHLAS